MATGGETASVRLGVLDYGAGNLRSVLNAFAAIGSPGKLVEKPEDFAQIDLLIFPGQGAFGDSVRILKKHDLWSPLGAWLRDRRPYLGICLGYQLLFEGSEESPGVAGLGVAGGVVRKFDPMLGLKIPHMGWNTASWAPGCELWHKGVTEPAHMYFVHSYYPDLTDESEALCQTDYGVRFASGMVRDHLMAVQFHPEKSQQIGLRLLQNAVAILSKKD